MGQSCTKACHVEHDADARVDSPDPVMYDLMRKSIIATAKGSNNHKRRSTTGQQHLLYKNAKTPSITTTNTAPTAPVTPNNTIMEGYPIVPCPTRLLIRRRSMRVLLEEGGGTHIYAIRYPEEELSFKGMEEQATMLPAAARQEQCPPRKKTVAAPTLATTPLIPILEGGCGDVFTTAAMASIPRQKVVDWVTVSEEHSIYIADVGLTNVQCDHIVTTTEQVCRGQYAAYTYAKQTLGCREYPILAQASFMPVHAVVHAIGSKLAVINHKLQLDDREPHIVKYDVTKKERQKLDMHTDKSEWTFLIALSNGCGVDYEGGGTYFECLDATVHIQRGHALIFPGKLRHCGQKITNGLRFLLVGFLVDKTANNNNNNNATATSTTPVDPPSTGVAPHRQ